MAAETFDLLARVAPGTSYTAGNDVLASDVTLGGTGTAQVPIGPVVVNICVAVSAAATFIARIGSQSLTFNAGSSLGAGSLYTFAFIGNPADAFNFRFGGNCTIRYFVVTVSKQ